MGRMRTHCAQGDGWVDEEKRSKGRRVMEKGSGWASEVPVGSVLMVFYWQTAYGFRKCRIEIHKHL